MYKVLELTEYEATRDVVLKNEETGTVVVCFDDSDTYASDLFGFIKIGQSYDFKIGMFGKSVKKARENVLVCKRIGDEIIGNVNRVKVSVGGDIYYISPEDTPLSSEFLFRCLRKDIIQVNDIVHERYR